MNDLEFKKMIDKDFDESPFQATFYLIDEMKPNEYQLLDVQTYSLGKRYSLLPLAHDPHIPAETLDIAFPKTSGAGTDILMITDDGRRILYPIENFGNHKDLYYIQAVRL